MKKILYRLFTIVLTLFIINNISAQTGFNLVGNATASGNCYTLTNGGNTQIGAAWNFSKTNLSEPFDIKASLFLGSNNGTGADGMAFVIQQQSINSGESGAGQGYGNITPSFIVEFDTYYNSYLNDPTYSHMSIQKNGDPSHNNGLTAPIPINADFSPADNGITHSVRFMWDPSTNIFKVYFDCQLKITYSGDIINTIFNGDPEVFWGFTAATGGNTNVQRVCDISNSQFITTQHNQDLCKGSNVQIQALQIPNASYSWDATTDISNSAVSNPIVNPTVNKRYICTITDNCYGDVYKDTFNILVKNTPETPSFTGNTAICVGNSLSLTASTNLAGSTFTWNGPNGFLSSLSQISINNMQQVNSGIYNLSAGLNGCTSSVLPVSIAVMALPDTMVNIIGNVCEGSTIYLAPINPNNTNIYYWTGPNGYSSNNTVEINNATTAANGIYNLLVTASNNCKATTSRNVIVNTYPIADILNTDTIICKGDNISLRYVATGNFSWQPANAVTTSGSTITVSPTDTTKIYLVADNNGCIAKDSLQINVHDKPYANAGNDIVIFENTDAIIKAIAEGTNITYTWSPSEYLNNANVMQPIAMPPADKTYTLTVNSEYCGSASDEINIIVLKEVVVPNTFTPNGDGINDTWVIKGLETYADNTLQVFNRYGQSIYSAKGAAKNWDGKFNGKLLPAGTYYYIIDLPVIHKKLSGWVLIMY